jgi:2,5-furandicarboxylate decarboxylase 1
MHGVSVMPFQDFREFLDALRKQGELFDVDRPVALKFEVAKALRKSAAIGGPAFLFKNNGTDFPLVGGVYNTRAKALIALESTEAAVVERASRRDIDQSAAEDSDRRRPRYRCA